MNKLCLSLLLPIACVMAIPSQYDIRHRFDGAQAHYEVKQGENHELPLEFWAQHFGPEFQQAVHFELGKTDLIDTSNTVSKDLPQSNRKRSTYVIHKPQAYEHENRTAHNSMKVHLLQPDEVESLEKQMINYARQHKMAESPVVVNLPVSEGSTKSKEHETPVVLNVPPVVYHHNNPNIAHPHYLANTRNSWSFNNNNPYFNSYGNSKTSHMKMQPAHVYARYPYESIQPGSINIASSYEYKNQISLDDLKQPSHGEQRQPSHEGLRLPSHEPKTPTYGEIKLPKGEMQPTKQPSTKVAKDSDKDKTV